MHTFALAIKMKEQKKYIEKQINTIKMRFRVGTSLGQYESIDVLISFLTTFKPEIAYFHINVRIILNYKLNEFFQCLKTLNKKVICFFSFFKLYL